MLLGENSKKQTRTEIPCNQNVIVIGSSGSGKTYSYVLSNLLQMNHSAVIVDYMGYLYNKYGKYFEENGIKVYNFGIIPETIDAELVEELGTKPVYIFLTPSVSVNHGAGRFINALWTELKNFGERVANGETEYKPKHKRDHYLPYPVHFYLDEFSNLSRLDTDDLGELHRLNIIPMFSISGRYGIGTSVILQSITQLSEHEKYKDNGNWETICGNADAHLFLNCISPEDLKYIRYKTELTGDITKQLFDNDLTIICSRNDGLVLSPKPDPEDYIFPTFNE